MHTFFSLIYFNYTVLYMFQTNKFIIRRLLLYVQHIVFSYRYVMSVCLSVHTEHLGSHWMDFHKI